MLQAGPRKGPWGPASAKPTCQRSPAVIGASWLAAPLICRDLPEGRSVSYVQSRREITLAEAERVH